MKTPLSLPLALLFSLSLLFHVDALAGTVKGSDNIISSTYDISDFTSISVSHAISVDIVQSKTFKVEIKHNDNLKEYLRVERNGETLSLRLAPGKSYRNTNISAVIHMPDLNGVDLSGASTMRIEKISTVNLKVELSGASQFTAFLEAEKLSIDGSGASNVFLEGSTEFLQCELSGASNLKAKRFASVQSSKFRASGACNMSIALEGEVSARLSGASNLIYYGSAVIVDQDISGASSIKGKAL